MNRCSNKFADGFSGVIMKLAYLILAHNKPQQLMRLIDRLSVIGPIFLHFDKRANVEDWKAVHRAFEERQDIGLVRRHKCYWGSYGIVAGAIELIRSLVESKTNFDYAMLLSGSDYP